MLAFDNRDLRSWYFNVNSHMPNTWGMSWIEGREIGQRVRHYSDWIVLENDSERSLGQSVRMADGIIPQEEVLVGSIV